MGPRAARAGSRRPGRSWPAAEPGPAVALSVPIIHPCWSGSISILVEGAAEPVPSADIEVRDPLRTGNRFRERAQWCGSPEGPVGPVLVVEVLELPKRVQEVALVPDEGAVQHFVAAGLHPVPLGNSVSYRELGFRCGFGSVAGTMTYPRMPNC